LVLMLLYINFYHPKTYILYNFDGLSNIIADILLYEDKTGEEK